MAYGGALQENMCREIPSSSFKTAEIQHASMSYVYCHIAVRQLSSGQFCNFCRTVPDTAGCDSILACRSLFSGSPLDMNALIRD